MSDEIKRDHEQHGGNNESDRDVKRQHSGDQSRLAPNRNARYNRKVGEHPYNDTQRGANGLRGGERSHFGGNKGTEGMRSVGTRGNNTSGTTRNDRPSGERYPGKPGFAAQSRAPIHRNDEKVGIGGNKPAWKTKKVGENGFAHSTESRKPMRGGDKPAGERRPFGDGKPVTDRKPFGAKITGDRKPFAARHEGDRKPMGDRRPFADKPAGERRTFAAKPGMHMSRRPVGVPVALKAAPRPVRKAAPTDGMPSRRMALEIIRQVTENNAYASLVLDEKLSACTLSHEDRRLVARLVYDTLEHLLYIDHALSQVMAKPDTDIKLRNILRLAACQIMLEDRIPESAATNTAVNLCKELGMEGLAGVCNGILRNLIRKKDELEWPSEDDDPVRALSIRCSVPEWLVQKLLDDWGYDRAVSLMSMHRNDTWITVRPNMLQLDDAGFEQLLEKKVWQHEQGPVPHSWRIRGMVDMARDADFVGGRFSIQGESSMMACMTLAPKRGWTVLDACAAPGGKSCLMAEMMGGSGRVQAWDVHPHRVDLIEAQVRRLKLENVRPLVRDASIPREDLIETMDAVLLDAPCSGTGDMADKPDVKYRPTQESVASLVATQAALLDAVAPYVKRGGVLVYSTCSVLKDENERQVSAFLSRHPEFKLEKLPESIPEQYRRYEETGLQLMPDRDDVGGFYMARMKRSRV